MENPFKTFVATCTRSLADDEAMRREVSFELNSHLEEAYEEELSRAESPEEAAEMAKKRFGQPEELAVQLLNANIKRFSFRARMRRLLKIFIIPLLILGVILCIDLRTWVSVAIFCQYITPVPDSVSNAVKWFYRVELRSHSPAREILTADWGEELALAESLYDLDPDSRIYNAVYAQHLASELTSNTKEGEKNIYTPEQDEIFDTFKRIITHGRTIDPDNALYDYLEASVLASRSLVWHEIVEPTVIDGIETERTVKKYSIADRAELDRAMMIYLDGLKKPVMESYFYQLSEAACDSLPEGNDVLRMMEEGSINVTRIITHIAMLRLLTSQVIFYSQVLREEGKQSSAEWLNSWEYFLPQILKGKYVFLDVFAVRYMAGIYLDALHEEGLDAPQLTNLRAVGDEWFALENPNEDIMREKKIIFSRVVAPKLDYELPSEYFTAENKLYFSIFDLLLLLPLALVLIIGAIVFALVAVIVRLFGRHPFIIILSIRDYLKILLIGIVLPLAVFYLYLHGSYFSGSDKTMEDILFRLVCVDVPFMVIYPVYFNLIVWWQLRKAGKNMGFRRGKIPLGTYCLNMMFFMVALLFITGGILRYAFNYDCKKYLAESGLNSTRHFITLEAQVANNLGKRMLDALQPDKE